VKRNRATFQSCNQSAACVTNRTWLMAVPLAALVMASPALADRIENKVAVFSGLDKVTARISTFEVTIGEQAEFGSLKVRPRACYSRPPTELPKTTTFVEVDEVQLDGSEKRIFTGWMFAESPGLHGVEHPTVDVWLTSCQEPSRVSAERPRARPADPIAEVLGETGAPDFDDGAGMDAAGEAPRRRVRR
jgi:hypothetical protein